MKWQSWELPTPERLGEKKEGHFLSISMGPQLLFILSAFFLPKTLTPTPPFYTLKKFFFFWSPLILGIYAGLVTATDKRLQ